MLAMALALIFLLTLPTCNKASESNSKNSDQLDLLKLAEFNLKKPSWIKFDGSFHEGQELARIENSHLLDDLSELTACKQN